MMFRVTWETDFGSLFPPHHLFSPFSVSVRLFHSPVWAEADAIHRAAVSMEDLRLAGRLFIHDPLQHII